MSSVTFCEELCTIPRPPKLFVNEMAENVRARCVCKIGCENCHEDSVNALPDKCSEHGQDWQVWCDTCQQPICIKEVLAGGRCTRHQTSLFPDAFDTYMTKNFFTLAFEHGQKFVAHLQQLRAQHEQVFQKGVSERTAKVVDEVKVWQTECDQKVVAIEQQSINTLEEKILDATAQKQQQQELVDEIKVSISSQRDVRIPEVDAKMTSRVRELEDELERVKEKLRKAQDAKEKALLAEHTKLEEHEQRLKLAETELDVRQQTVADFHSQREECTKKMLTTITQKQKEREEHVDIIIKSVHEMGRKSLAVWQAWSAEVQRLEQLVEAKIMEARSHSDLAPSAEESAKYALIAIHQLMRMIHLFSNQPLPTPPDAVPVLGFENASEVELFQQLVEVVSHMYHVKFSCWSTPASDQEGIKRNQEETVRVQTNFTEIKQKYESVGGKVFGTSQLHEFLLGKTKQSSPVQRKRLERQHSEIFHECTTADTSDNTSHQETGNNFTYRLFGRTTTVRGGS